VDFRKQEEKNIRITSQDVYKILKDAGWIDTNNMPIWFILDSEFVLPSDQEVQEILESDRTDEKPYVPERGDCDNYAFELRHAFGRLGWAVGMIAVDTGTPPLHAIFFYINEDRKPIAIEPQDDSVFNKPFKLVAVEMH
jgi:hypothetical protein